MNGQLRLRSTCEESVVPIYAGEGQALDGKFDQDTIVLSFVQPRREPFGSLHLMRVSRDNQVLADADDAGNVMAMFGFNTSLAVYDGLFALTYYTILPRSIRLGLNDRGGIKPDISANLLSPRTDNVT